MAQFGRPNSDITTTNWSTSSGSGTLASHIDETTFSDTDYILTTTDDASCEVALSSVTDPAVSTGHIVRWRWRVANAGGGGERGGAFLVQGATTKATLATSYNLNRTAYDAMSYTLTGTEADSITDYSDLRLRFTAEILGASEELRVSWAEMEVPDAGATFTQSVSGTLSFAGSATKQTGKMPAGALSFGGALIKRTDKILAGALTFGGALVKQTGKMLSGAVSFAGDLAAQLITAGKGLPIIAAAKRFIHTRF